METVTRSSRFVSWAVLVVIVCLVVLGWQIDRRTQAISTIEQSAHRIEAAALHTEQLLVETLEARQSEDAMTFQLRVREALQEIREIKTLLCDTLEPEHELCQEVSP